MSRRTFRCLAIAVGLIGIILLIPSCRALLRGYVAGEPFHDGQPLGYWVAQAQYQPLLRIDVHNDGSQTRHHAFEALIAMGRAAVPALAELACESDAWAVRIEAATSLGQLGAEAKDAAPQLMAAFQHETTWMTRAQIVETLGQIDREAALPILLEALKDEYGHVRLMAATQLQHVQGVATPNVIAALKRAIDVETDAVNRKAMTEAVERLSANGYQQT